jgi:hypothetical protein
VLGQPAVQHAAVQADVQHDFGANLLTLDFQRGRDRRGIVGRADCCFDDIAAGARPNNEQLPATGGLRRRRSNR